MTFKDKIENYRQTVSSLKAELCAGISEELQAAVKNSKYIKAVRFEAYTPYFNDGEPCIYRVHEPRVQFFNQDEDIETEYEDGFISPWDLEYTWENGWGSKRIYKEGSEEKGQALEEIHALITSIPKEIIEDAYGDGVQVTITADGVTVEEYDHD